MTQLGRTQASLARCLLHFSGGCTARLGRGILFAVAFLAVAAAAQEGRGQPVDWSHVETHIETDGSLGNALEIPDGPNATYEIPDTLGRWLDENNLFHSFSHFDLGSGDTAVFTAYRHAENVISRMTGGPSYFNGTLSSEIPPPPRPVPGTGLGPGPTSFYFLNPNGVFFGPNASLDIPGSFHVSTADRIPFDGDAHLVFHSDPHRDGSLDSILRIGALESFGFLGPPDPLASAADPESEILIDGSQLVAKGAIELNSGTILVRACTPGDVSCSATNGNGSDESFVPGLRGGSLFLRAQKSVKLDGPESESGLLLQAAALQIEAPEILIQRTDLLANDMKLFATDHLDATDILIAQPPPGPNVRILRNNLSALGAFDNTSVIGADPSLEGPGPEVTLQGSVLRGQLEIAGARVEIADSLLLGGAPGGRGGIVDRCSSGTPCPGGSGERSALIARKLSIIGEEVGISGSRLDVVPDDSGDGEISVRGGVVKILASELRAESGVHDIGVEVAAVGGISVVADEEILIEGGMRVDLGSGNSESSAISTRTSEADVAAGSILFRAPVVRIENDALVTSQSDAEGKNAHAGDVSVVARQAIISDATMTVSAKGENNGGKVGIEGSQLIVVRRSQISSRVDAGVGGNATLRAGGGIAIENSTVTAESGIGGGGNVSISAGDLLTVRDGSELSARVGSGTGGSVELFAKGIVLRDASSITASAGEEGGSGGRIEINARALVSSPGSLIDASAPGGPEFQGEVVINSPEVTTNETITRPETSFADPAALIRPSCVARKGQGSFTVARRRGLPVSPEGLLIAFDDFGEGDLAVAGTGDEAEEELPPVASAGPDDAPAAPPMQVALARGAFRGGNFEDAKTRWAEVAAEGEGSARGTALRGLAQSQLALGEYGDSIETLQQALNLAEESGDSEQITAAVGALANAYLAVGEADRSAALFSRGIALAKESEQPALAARLLNNLGNLQASRSKTEEALRAYQDSAREARKVGSSVVAAQAQANAARAALVLGRIDEAGELLQQADLGAAALPLSHAGTALRIHLAGSYELLATASPPHASLGMLRAHAALMAAIRQARTLGDDRLRSLALGNLGALYARENRIEEALYLARRAARAADAADAIDLLPRWYWLEGKLLWAEGQAEAAVAAYQRAVDLLEETRQETLARYGGDVNFRRALAPVYLDLVDALLQGSGRLSDAAQSQALLRSARATMEQLKAAELRDYFQNECVAELEAKARPLETVSGRTAVVYPILLPDRIELLVGIPDAGLVRHAVAIDATTARRAALRFGQEIRTRTKRVHQRSAQVLYDWLVRPYLPELEQAGIDTLVFVPDGILRTIPMAALHDGEQFLVERYALAVAPSLSLVDPKPLDLAQSQLLLAGLSEPRDVAGMHFGKLDLVPTELEEVQARYGGELLLNEDFQTERIEAALDQAPPSIVHLATHAVFTGEAETSFIVTHDGKLTIDELGEAVGRSRFAQEPLELLMLSACQTAAGDERAALGLAGVAVRAGARSAFGSLWKVSDRAAYEAVVAFYEELGKPGATKAQALQRAQQQMLATAGFEHPFYWAPFLVINNWL